MRSMHVAMLAFALSLPLPSAAQSGAAQDTTQPAPKKHGGLFGKVKGLAKNKLVQQVAKTAACNMVPGGQLVAGAIDNASAKKAAKNAATNAAKDAVAGAALGAAAGKSSLCGGGLMGGLGGNLGGNVGGNLAAAGIAKGVAGVGIPAMPTTGMPGVGTSADQMKQMAEQYQKMGMNPVQIKAMQQQMQMAAAATPGTGMPAGGISPEQIKQMEEQYRKMGMDPAQIKAMLQMMTDASAGEAEQSTPPR
ncbi:MAG TPA: hypothetical protein VGR09_15065 [Gemmatimonadales bacterium]|nr:hypothetical protein [Gemmatimonadales bacterium]